MTISTFYADNTNRYIRSRSASWDTARAGSEFLLIDDGNLRVGHERNSINFKRFIWNAFVVFDTAALGSDSVTDVELSMFAKVDDVNADNDHIQQARAGDPWDTTGVLATTDYVPGDDQNADTLLATFDTTTYTDETYEVWTNEAGTVMIDHINKSGDTLFMFSTDWVADNVSPVGYNSGSLTWLAGSDGTDGPKLVVTHALEIDHKNIGTHW